MNGCHELPNHYVLPVLSNGQTHPSSPVEYRVTYKNTLHQPITVGWRNGLKFAINPEPTTDVPVFKVRIDIYVNGTARNDFLTVLNSMDIEKNDELKIIKDGLSFQIRDNFYNGAHLTIEYPINLNELENLGGSVYLNEIDCVISTKTVLDCPTHPYSQEGLEQNLLVVNTSGKGFGYAIDIVDTVGKYGDRYINVQGKVYRVVAKPDTARRDGIYITANASVDNINSPTHPVVEYYSFSQSSEIGLFKTIEEAGSLGDAVAAQKKQLLELEHELTLLKKRLQIAEQNSALELSEKNALLADLDFKMKEQKNEIEKNKIKQEEERLAIKEFYENRSYRRKDESETWKIIPAIILGIGSLFMGFKTIFGK